MNIGVRIPEHVVALKTAIKTRPSCEKVAVKILRRILPSAGAPSEWRAVEIAQEAPQLYMGIVPLSLLDAKPGMVMQLDWENEEEIVEITIDWEYVRRHE
jgi:hypothetical protein